MSLFTDTAFPPNESIYYIKADEPFEDMISEGVSKIIGFKRPQELSPDPVLFLDNTESIHLLKVKNINSRGF